MLRSKKSKPSPRNEAEVVRVFVNIERLSAYLDRDMSTYPKMKEFREHAEGERQAALAQAV